MEHILLIFVVLLALMLLISIINEKFLHISNEIALVIFSLIVSGLILGLKALGFLQNQSALLQQFFDFPFDKFLMDGILCFMLFAGAQKVHFGKFVKNIRPISFLAFLSTCLTSLIYGGLFYGLNLLLGLNMDIWLAILLGCIVSPTDPIAATAILNKCGLSKSVSSVIEGESLFNDGLGVALFICIRNIVTGSSDLSLPLLLLRELGGAIVIGLLVSFVLFRLFKLTSDPVKHITISLLTVSLSYVICEKLGFSGVIASVVCGMYFAYSISKIKNWRLVVDPRDLYPDFWEILDSLLNNMLFVLIGLAMLFIPTHKAFIWLVLGAIGFNLLARFNGVFLTSLFLPKKNIPNFYTRFEFVSLLSWAGLKGGLSLALAMSTGQFLLKAETANPEHYHVIMLVTFATIIFTVIFQGLTTSKVFRAIERHKAARQVRER